MSTSTTSNDEKDTQADRREYCQKMIKAANENQASDCKYLVLGRRDPIISKGETKDVDRWGRGVLEITGSNSKTSDISVLMHKILGLKPPTSYESNEPLNLQQPIWKKDAQATDPSLIHPDLNRPVDSDRYVILDRVKDNVPVDMDNLDINPDTGNPYLARDFQYKRSERKAIGDKWEYASRAICTILFATVKDDTKAKHLQGMPKHIKEDPYALYNFLREKAQFTGEQLPLIKQYVNALDHSGETLTSVTSDQLLSLWEVRRAKTKDIITNLFKSKSKRNYVYENWLMTDGMKLLKQLSNSPSEWKSFCSVKSDEYNRYREILVNHECNTSQDDPSQILNLAGNATRAKIPSARALEIQSRQFHRELSKYGKTRGITPDPYISKRVNAASSQYNDPHNGKSKLRLLCSTCWRVHEDPNNCRYKHNALAKQWLRWFSATKNFNNLRKNIDYNDLVNAQKLPYNQPPAYIKNVCDLFANACELGVKPGQSMYEVRKTKKRQNEQKQRRNQRDQNRDYRNKRKWSNKYTDKDVERIVSKAIKTYSEETATTSAAKATTSTIQKPSKIRNLTHENLALAQALAKTENEDNQ